MSDFDWSENNDDVTVRKQAATAVYWNTADEIVIRQENHPHDDEDGVVVLSRDAAERVAMRLRALLDGET